ncbi:hypothetical protein PFISCL1PPCAC_27068, partial [Pristionchus fissidentatus]
PLRIGPADLYIHDVMFANRNDNSLEAENSLLQARVRQLEAALATTSNKLKDVLVDHTTTLYQLLDTAKMATHANPSNINLAKKAIKTANKGLKEIREEFRRNNLVFDGTMAGSDTASSSPESSGRSSPMEDNQEAEDENTNTDSSPAVSPPSTFMG